MDTVTEIAYAKMVKNLVKPGDAILANLTELQAHLIHMTMGISGEAGELLDGIKKYVIYNKTLDMNNIVEELGDIEFYLQGLRESLGVTREQTLIRNMTKLAKRYEGYAYTDQAAHARADKAE